VKLCPAPIDVSPKQNESAMSMNSANSLESMHVSSGREVCGAASCTTSCGSSLNQPEYTRPEQAVEPLLVVVEVQELGAPCTPV
jgi:hypothetical protein